MVKKTFSYKDAKALYRLCSDETQLLNGCLDIPKRFESNIDESVRKIKHDATMEKLRFIEIENLRKEAKGLQLKLIEDEGFRYISDIINSSVDRLMQIRYISRDRAMAIADAAWNVYNRINHEVHIQFDPENTTPVFDNLVVSINRLFVSRNLIKQHKSAIEQCVACVNTLQEQLHPATFFLSWWFTTASAKENAIRAYTRLLSREAEFATAYSLKGKLSVLSTIDKQAAWNHFSCNKTFYYSAIYEAPPVEKRKVPLNNTICPTVSPHPYSNNSTQVLQPEVSGKTQTSTPSIQNHSLLVYENPSTEKEEHSSCEERSATLPKYASDREHAYISLSAASTREQVSDHSVSRTSLSVEPPLNPPVSSKPVPVHSNTAWTKDDELSLINRLQDQYVEQIRLRLSQPLSKFAITKEIQVISDTGTGKTIMMAKLICAMPDTFFIVTSLSRGGLYHQIENQFQQRCPAGNYEVFGAQQLTKATRLTSEMISALVAEKRIQYNRVVWVRDESHIHSRNWTRCLEDSSDRILGFSATVSQAPVAMKCNFYETCMLRTVEQSTGEIYEALDTLLEVKRAHSRVPHYNPCALFRVTSEESVADIIDFCNTMGFKWISLVDEDHEIQPLCEDDCEYDVIINKMKIVEGIDIRRAHVLYIENQPSSVSTVIQLVGRVRRNALLWRDDIDIFSPENAELFEATKRCYVFYGKQNTALRTDEDGSFLQTFCPYIPISMLSEGKIFVSNGKMPNGLSVIELKGCSGEYNITTTQNGTKIVDNAPYYLDELRLDACGAILPNDLRALNRSLAAKTSSFWELLRRENLYGFQCIYIDVNGKLKRAPESADWRSQGKLLFAQSNGEYVRLLPSEVDRMINTHELVLSSLRGKRSVLYNTRELAELCDGIYDHRRSPGGGMSWHPVNNVTSLVSRGGKFRDNLCKRYAAQLNAVSGELFSGQYNIGLNRRYHSVLGFCVEWYARYLSCGDSVLGKQFADELAQVEFLVSNYEKIKTMDIYQDIHEFLDTIMSDPDYYRKSMITVCCLEKYKTSAQKTYTRYGAFRLPNLSVDELIKEDGRRFVLSVYELASRAAAFIRENIDVDRETSVPHSLVFRDYAGLMDVCDGTTVIDIKCTNSIIENHILQVLAYHYLSQHASDLDIQRVIVYDAVSGKSISIRLPQEKKCSFACDDFFFDDTNDGAGTSNSDLHKVFDQVKNALTEETSKCQ